MKFVFSPVVILCSWLGSKHLEQTDRTVPSSVLWPFSGNIPWLMHMAIFRQWSKFVILMCTWLFLGTIPCLSCVIMRSQPFLGSVSVCVIHIRWVLPFLGSVLCVSYTCAQYMCVWKIAVFQDSANIQMYFEWWQYTKSDQSCSSLACYSMAVSPLVGTQSLISLVHPLLVTLWQCHL